MRHTLRLFAGLVLPAAGLAAILFAPACGLSPSGSSGGSGTLNVLVTDSPTDDWQEVTVVLKSLSLRRGFGDWVDVWTADPANPNAGTLNLVDLSGVAQFLAKSTIPAGHYNRLKLTINTDPATMKLVDDTGATIPASDITVVDPSHNGAITVDIDPAIEVDEGQTANLQVDFDLAHPLSIVVEAGKVVLNLQIRHKAVPANLRDLQFARNYGNVTAVAADGFSMKTLQGADLDFKVNADTIYVDVDANGPGTFAGLTVNKGVLVASNMNADGSLYARRVWYAADVNSLPRFTPEGLVRRVGDTWFKVLQKKTGATTNTCWDWEGVLVYVNADTAWTFHDTIAMGTGLDMLHNIRRGFRVSVEYVDANASPKVAKAVNVQSAHDEGFITDTSTTGFSFGWWDYHTRTLAYSAVTDHAFKWWFYGFPASASTSVQDFMDIVNQAHSANLWVFAVAGLTWDQANGRWAVEDLVLAPEKLHDLTRITTGYDAASGSMVVSTFDWWDATAEQVMTILLDQTGDLQTVVESVSFNTTSRISTVTIPVPPADWPKLLVPALHKVKVWVRPVKANDGTFSWHAYTVIAYRISG